VWPCRALPFDRDLLGANKTSTNTQLNVFVKGLPTELSTEELDHKFAETFGEVKSAKISRSAPHKDKKTVDPSLPPVSNGYGFVCFQNKEAADKAISTS
jgi:RNA recognition motif-containing protein